MRAPGYYIPPAMTFTHFVFVDFENVPSVDLALLEGKPVHVTLVIGEKQTRLELALVRHIHRYAQQVDLIEVGASGRNALDFVLAAHLGRAMHEHPDAEFAIISRDRDFDPLVVHFKARKMRVVRAPEFSALPVFGAPKPATPTTRSRVAAKPAPTAKKTVAAVAANPDVRQEKIEKLVTGLSSIPNRPKTRDSLLHYIRTAFGQKIPAEEQEGILNELLPRGIFTIPDGKKLVYAR